jgi:hypothetical protein
MALPLADYRKGLTALAGALADALALGLLHGTAQQWAVIVLNALTVIGIVAIRNGTKPPPTV